MNEFMKSVAKVKQGIGEGRNKKMGENDAVNRAARKEEDGTRRKSGEHKGRNRTPAGGTSGRVRGKRWCLLLSGGSEERIPSTCLWRCDIEIVIEDTFEFELKSRITIIARGSPCC